MGYKSAFAAMGAVLGQYTSTLPDMVSDVVGRSLPPWMAVVGQCRSTLPIRPTMVILSMKSARSTDLHGKANARV